MIFDSPLVEEKEHASAESRTNEVVPTLPAAAPRHYPGRGRKTALLIIFTLSVAVDVLSLSAFFVFTGPISRDFAITFEEQSWIITSYTVTFASFLLFWGRISDLWSAKPVFTIGFVAVGLANLILSFIPDKYSFFVIRALTGIAAAALVPSAYRLIAFVYPPEERGKAYTIYGMTGSIANVAGTIIAGVIDLIPNEGQMRSYRWFFRMIAAISLPAAVLGMFLIPNDRDVCRPARTAKESIKLMDLPGIITMFSAMLLLILGLTLGATYGWTSASFLVPFLLSALLFPAFFIWEARIPEVQALVPPAIWRIPNIAVLLAFTLITFGWWAVNFIPFIEMFNQVYGEHMLIAAARTLPEGVAAGAIGILLIKYPRLIERPKWPIVVSMLFCAGAYGVWTQAPSVVGRAYWTHVFAPMFLGSGGMQVVLLSTNVGVMLAAPSERTGVVGALFQTALQTSGVVALSIQAGCFSTYGGGIQNFANVRLSWYIELGWIVLWLVGFLCLYKPDKTERKTHIQMTMA